MRFGCVLGIFVLELLQKGWMPLLLVGDLPVRERIIFWEILIVEGEGFWREVVLCKT